MHSPYRTGVPLLSRERFFIYLINKYISLYFLRHAAQSQFIPLQNVEYFIMLPFLSCKIFTVYINDVLNFKCPAPGPKG